MPRVTIEDRWHFAADEGESVPSALHFLPAEGVIDIRVEGDE
ncbi:hypothetical protein [Microbispora bryophytorum]